MLIRPTLRDVVASNFARDAGAFPWENDIKSGAPATPDTILGSALKSWYGRYGVESTTTGAGIDVVKPDANGVTRFVDGLGTANFDLTQATDALKPAVKDYTARKAIECTGTGANCDRVTSTSDTGNMISAAAGWIFALYRVVSADGASGSPWANSLVIGDSGQFFGIYRRDTGTQAYAWDTGAKTHFFSASLNVFEITMLRWSGADGKLYARHSLTNSGARAELAFGATMGSITGKMQSGQTTAAVTQDQILIEAVVGNADITAGQEEAVMRYLAARQAQLS